MKKMIKERTKSLDQNEEQLTDRRELILFNDDITLLICDRNPDRSLRARSLNS